MKYLKDHVSPETAHMHDHPFGTKRCIQRVWLHTATKGAKEGQTCVFRQTTQKHVYSAGDDLPETMPAGGADRNANWNKGKKDTYSDGITILYLNEEDHVHAFCLRVIDQPERFKEFDEIVDGQLSDDDADHRQLMEKMNRKHYPERWSA